MQEKPKRKRKDKMSRRQFLQIGITTSAIGISACISSQWASLFPSPTPTVDPTALANANCYFTWGPNTTRINEANSALLQEALFADGLTPTYVEVYDRAMEYQTCVDDDNNTLFHELLYRDNEGVTVIFDVDNAVMNEDTLKTLIEDVYRTLGDINNLNTQDLTVQISNGDNTLTWRSSPSAGSATPANDLYTVSITPER